MDEDATLRQRAIVPLILIGIFSLALFIRAYFAWDIALRDLLVSGGSDAYYYAWINEYIANTGSHLVHDPMLNFPLGMNNPRPPIYAFSVVLSGILLNLFEGSLELSIWHSFLFSTALWGALTIFPTYFIGKQTLGRHAGLVAALFLALLPAHIQRTPLSNGDHDALVLFFVVTSFFFFLKALGELKEREWVRSWIRPREILGGLRGLVQENPRALLFSVMSGTAMATVALTWQGWAYGPVVIIAYFLVQILVHKIRNRDPLGVLVLFAITLGTTLLLAGPYYVVTGFVRTWYDVPLLLFLGALGLGFLFTIFHRLPWLLVVAPVLLGFGAGLALAAALSPTVASTLSSGFGYFVPNKVFETISEAQPPDFSLLMTSFGMVTSVLAFIGIALMALQFIRRPRPDYLFLLAWSAAAIYMAVAAVRFIFNASPAIALASAWVVMSLVERLGLGEVRKAVATTGGSRLTAFRKELRFRHIAAAFFIAALIMIPNAWAGIDAGIPFEKKRDYDVEVYRATPDFLRPPNYQEGTDLFFFGGFGYSLPLKTRYYPRAWEWLSTQDADVFPLSDRPAYLSWWDYGFEAIQAGRHPAVADNFQNGYEFAGHFLTSQSENEGIAVLTTRLLHGEVLPGLREFTPAVREVLAARGLDPDLIRDVLARPAAYVPLIRADPEQFGIWDDSLSARNALVIYLRGYLTEALELDGQAALYEDLMAVTDRSIRYFAVDSRLVPFSGTNTGIFYATVKLTDHRTIELPDLRSIPVDFYQLIAVTDQGNFPLNEVPVTARISNIQIEYQEPFYSSLFYRIFFGIRGSDVGLADDGLPAFSGELAGESPIHAWMLKHFQLVYRTAYFNPYPREEVANHTDAWTALNLPDAVEIQGKINAGETIGTVDLNPATNLVQGVVILKYSDGATVQGHVTSETGAPLAGVRVTALDAFGVPHDVVETDAAGAYALTAPFGNVSMLVSTGPVDNRTQVGSQFLDQASLELPDRGLNGGGANGPIEQDFALRTATVRGIAFRDLDGDGNQGTEEASLPGLTVEARTLTGNLVATTTTALDGSYALPNLLPGIYPLRLMRGSAVLANQSVDVALGSIQEENLGVRVGQVRGSLRNEFNEVAPGAVVTLEEVATGTRWETSPDASGNYSFTGLIAGNYALAASLADSGTLTELVEVFVGGNTTRDLLLQPLGTVSGRTVVNFRPTGFVSLRFYGAGDAPTHTVVTDASSHFATDLPLGTYTLYTVHVQGDGPHALLQTVEVRPGTTSLGDLLLQPAARVTGTVLQDPETPVEGAAVTFERAQAPLRLTSGRAGAFLAYLPPGTYQVWTLTDTGQQRATHIVSGDVDMPIVLTPGLPTFGEVYYDKNRDGLPDEGEALGGVRIDVSDSAGGTFALFTQADGFFQVALREELQYTLAIQHPGFEPLTLGPLAREDLSLLDPIPLAPLRMAVAGQLRPLDTAIAQETPIVFLPLADGAQEAQLTADAQGRFSGVLFPGLYRIQVDAPLGSEDERIQDASTPTLRVPVGRPPSTLAVDVVRRVQVEGFLTVEGQPFNGSLIFQGIENRTLPVAGAYAGFLRLGEYTLYATATVTGARFALLEVVTLSAPTNFTEAPTNISALEPAAVLAGTVSAAGTALPEGRVLTFRRGDGASLTVATGTGGAYEAVLVEGTYLVSLDWRGVDDLDGMHRYVRYILQEQVTLAAGEQPGFPLIATRTLETAPVTGTVVFEGLPASARVAFEAINETAIDVAVDVFGVLSVNVAPGQYNVYALRQSGSAVSLTQVTVSPGTGATVEIVLQTGYGVTGVAHMPDGSEARATVAFVAGAGVNATTDSFGLFQVTLPKGVYSVVATVERDERGVNVEYRATEDLALTANAVLNLPLQRVDRPQVVVSWDEAQRGTVVPGERIDYTLVVRNPGNVDEEVVFDGNPEGWGFRFTPNRVPLPFGVGSEAEVTVTITVPEAAKVQHPQLFVGATAVANASVRDVAFVEVDVVHFRDVGLQLGEDAPILTPQALEYSVQVVNTGNGVDTFEVLLLNAETLKAQGWTPTLSIGNQTGEDRVGDILAGSEEAPTVTLRLEASGPLRDASASLAARSQTESEVEATLDIQLTFPVLALPEDGIRVEGRNIQMTPTPFPIAGYGVIAGIAALVAFLAIRRRRRRRRGR